MTPLSETRYCPLCGAHELEWGDSDSHTSAFVVLRNNEPVFIHIREQAALTWIATHPDPPGVLRVVEVRS